MSTRKETWREKISAFIGNFQFYLEDPDLYCSCGHPSCQDHAQFRKGYCCITEGDTKEERWDYFYINAYGTDEPRDKNWKPILDGRNCEDCEGMRKSICSKGKEGQNACDSFILRLDHRDRIPQSVEVMLPPERGRELMWFLILKFMPGVSQFCREWNYQLSGLMNFIEGEE